MGASVIARDCASVFIADELDPVNSVSDHAGYGIGTAAAKAYKL